MNEQLTAFLRRQWPDADEIVIERFEPIPGGFSRETFRFDARVRRGGAEELVELILRKDPPAASAILHSDRRVEHDLLHVLRRHTNLPVARGFGYDLGDELFGAPAMVLERHRGNPRSSELFYGGPHEDEAEAVATHLCELIAELHTLDFTKLDLPPEVHDPRGAGIDTSSWDAYMDTTFQYYCNGYYEAEWTPQPVYMDLFLTLRRNRPRPLRLSLIHGDFNPANFLFEGGRVSGLIDWENTRIGDPREDLGWMKMMDFLSHTNVMGAVRKEGGFLNYYNKLTGFDVTQEELDYFTIFGTANIAVPVGIAMKNRMTRQHMELLHLYLVQVNVTNGPNYARMLGYPGFRD